MPLTKVSPPVGAVVQRVSTNFDAVGTTTTVIPVDDTIPQITEGGEFMTQAITPKSTTNELIIEATVTLSNSVATSLVAALFQDATANALCAECQYQTTATGMVNLVLRFRMLAGTVSATTFRIRAGGAAAGTTTFNGAAAGRFFGAIPKSNITITEVRA